MGAQQLSELVTAVQQRLTTLGVDAATPAYDGWLRPQALRAALLAAAAGDKLLMRGCEAQVTPAQDDESGPLPAEPVWLLVTAGTPSLQLIAMREAASSSREIADLTLAVQIEQQLCCDAKKCSAHKSVARLALRDGDGAGEWLLAEAIADTDEAARNQLAGIEEALRQAWEQPAEEERSKGSAGAAFAATELARFGLRSEGEMMVLRDYASLGPRQSSAREHLVLALLLLGSLGSWFGAWRGFQAAAYEQLAIFGAVAAVLSTAAFAGWRIARHSAAYRAHNEPLLFVHRDRLVVAPWLTRAGAVLTQPSGRYGAALPLREVQSIAPDKLGEGNWAILCDTDHGPMHIGDSLSEPIARAWSQRLSQLVEAYKHEPAPIAVRNNRQAVASVALLALLALLAAAGCDTPAPQHPLPQGSSSSVASAAPSATSASVSPSAQPSASAVASNTPVAAPRPKLVMVDDDMPGALAKAKADNKAVFVEVWAPWCHTCLSMKSFVLPDPTIVALQDEVLFAAVDSDQPVNAAFMERYAVNVWPTMFVLDPAGEVLGLWEGAASVNELRAFIRDALDVGQAKRQPNGPLNALIMGRRAQARGQYAQAAIAYGKALSDSPTDWPRRGEATVGLIRSHARLGQWDRCARLGRDSIATIEGAALPTDVSYVLLSCAKRLADRSAAAALFKQVGERLARHVASPPAGSSVDDRVDALSLYAQILRDNGDIKGARGATRQQLQLLEQAAEAAPNPEAAATFDYARMNAYLSLGRGEEAVKVLSLRMKQLPDAYEPAARLAQTLMALRRYEEARAAAVVAVDKSYGPRQLGYLNMLANILHQLKDRPGEIQALQALVAAYGKLADKQRGEAKHRAGLKTAKQRLAQLQAAR